MGINTERLLTVSIAGVLFDIKLPDVPNPQTKEEIFRHKLATSPIDKLNSVLKEVDFEFVSICDATSESLNRDKLIDQLVSFGFDVYVPRTSSWNYALTYSNQKETLYVLFGKRSISFKYYTYLRELKLDEQGKLYTDEGRFVRNYYQDSAIFIHKHILHIAKKFLCDEKLSGIDFIEHGVSQLSLKRSQIAALHSSEHNSSSSESQYVPDVDFLANWEKT